MFPRVQLQRFSPYHKNTANCHTRFRELPVIPSHSHDRSTWIRFALLPRTYRCNTRTMIAGTAESDPEPERLGEEKMAANQQPRAKGHLEPLFENNVDGEFRSHWREIQAGFVDEPRNAAERADELVAELMQKLAQSFSKQRNDLEHQWDASANVSTEDLRVALTRYRSFSRGYCRCNARRGAACCAPTRTGSVSGGRSCQVFERRRVWRSTRAPGR